MHIFDIWIQVHFVPAATNPNKVFYDVKRLFRKVMVFPELQPNVYAPIFLALDRLSINSSDAFSI